MDLTGAVVVGTGPKTPDPYRVSGHGGLRENEKDGACASALAPARDRTLSGGITGCDALRTSRTCRADQFVAVRRIAIIPV